MSVAHISSLSSDLVCELTPNEYEKMMLPEHRPNYNVYIINNALVELPAVPVASIFKHAGYKKWLTDDGRKLIITRKVAMDSVQKHLAIFVASIQSDPRRISALKDHDWTKFAKAYNGEQSEGYDTQMAAAYKALSRPPAATAPVPPAGAR